MLARTPLATLKGMQTIRRVAPFVYVIAILVTALVGPGQATGAVAAIGGILLAALYALTGGLNPRPKE